MRIAPLPRIDMLSKSRRRLAMHESLRRHGGHAVAHAVVDVEVLWMSTLLTIVVRFTLS
ncbi:MAG: hypothetical protein GAK41_00738 [Burkholderia gladioli]|nr:MAG: hypothetical protein GAK41_00738 [Burkholderia gladioli]